MGLQINDLVQVTYNATFEGQQIRYVLHYRCMTNGNGSIPEVDLNTMSSFFVDQAACPLFAAMLDCHVADFHFTGAACTRVWPVKTTTMMNPVDIVGEVIDTGMPPNVSVVITKRTLQQGRRGRGSLHLSGVPIPWTLNGEIVVASAGPWNALAEQLYSVLTPSPPSLNIEPVLYHPTLITNPWSKLFNARLETTTRTMRRRTVRVGI